MDPNNSVERLRCSTIHVGKTKTLISFSVIVKLICVFVFAYANCWFSHAKAHIVRFYLVKNLALVLYYMYLQQRFLVLEFINFKWLQNITR